MIPPKLTADGQAVPDVRAIWTAADTDQWEGLVDRRLRRHAVDWADAWTEFVAFATSLYQFEDELPVDEDPAYGRLNELVWDALQPIRERATEQTLTAIQEAVETFTREYPDLALVRVGAAARAA